MVAFEIVGATTVGVVVLAAGVVGVVVFVAGVVVFTGVVGVTGLAGVVAFAEALGIKFMIVSFLLEFFGAKFLTGAFSKA